MRLYVLKRKYVLKHLYLLQRQYVQHETVPTFLPDHIVQMETIKQEIDLIK